MLSLIQQNHQGSCTGTLDRAGSNMVLQSFDIGLHGSDNMPPYAGDYAPTTAFYTDLDTSLYSQGKLKKILANFLNLIKKKTKPI